jgi:hypothetical protein
MHEVLGQLGLALDGQFPASWVPNIYERDDGFERPSRWFPMLGLSWTPDVSERWSPNLEEPDDTPPDAREDRFYNPSDRIFPTPFFDDENWFD